MGEMVEKLAAVIGYHFAALVSRNNQPCMSGDPRDRLLPHHRRQFDSACQEAARAVIEGMQEPTPRMIDAGVAFALNVSLGGGYGWSQYVADKHASMMRAALSTETEERNG